MRITRDILLNLARENVAKMTASDRGIACVLHRRFAAR